MKMAAKRIDFSEDNDEDICERIIEVLRRFPEGVELYTFQTSLPDLSPTALGDAFNSLFNAGKIDLFKSAESKGLKYKLKSSTSPRDVDSSNIQNDQEKNVASTSHGAGSAAKKRRLISSSSQMEIFAKNIQIKKLKTVRDDFFCRRCKQFPRDAVFQCSNCDQIFCNDCCDDKCTFCRNRIIEDPRLTALLSSFGTHPCNYLKNGCHEEIIANMDTLNAHDLSCIFQKVPCPKLDCHEKIIFKDVDQHLKKCHSDILLVYIAGENHGMLKYNNRGNTEYDGYGIYNSQSDTKVNGRKYYSSEKFGIWWNIEKKKWFLGLIQDLGSSKSIAYFDGDIEIHDNTTNAVGAERILSRETGEWFLFLQSVFKSDVWETSVVLKDVSHDLTDEWSFEGTKEELFGSFCRLNAYNRQFYPQFKEDNNRLMFRMIMLGLKEEANPFEVMITFFHDTGTLFEWKDRVYPITKDKSSIFETSSQCHLEKLTEYYDNFANEDKNQPKIIFTMKILNPKLDKIRSEFKANHRMMTLE